jgi:hypothetical protein
MEKEQKHQKEFSSSASVDTPEEERREETGGELLSRRKVLQAGLGTGVALGVAGVLLEATTSRSSRSTPEHVVPVNGSTPTELSAVSITGNVVLQWSNVCLQAIRDIKPGPPMVARALAIMHTCIYDAWAAYDQEAVGTRLGGSLRRPVAEHTLANKNQAISYAAYRALVDLFPADMPMFNFLMHKLGYDPANRSTDATTPAGVGNRAAQAVINFRHRDGANQLGDLHPGAYSDYTHYVPINSPSSIKNPNYWQPLRVANGLGGFTTQTYVGAQWGHVIPFALSSGSQFRPSAPPMYPSREYQEEVEQLIQYSANLTDEQKVIAEYWADGPTSELPPGHWCLFAHFVSLRDHHDLDADVKLFFMVANAVFDAGIAAWDAKRAYNSVRPVTAIHYLFKGKQIKSWAGPYLGTQVIDGRNWLPYQAVTVVTPPFPEYISGHSTFSAAAAEVLKRFTGNDVLKASYTQKAGTSRFETGVLPTTDITLSWATFSDAADQAGLSRRYGGIHFEPGDMVGRHVGRLVGTQVWNKALSYIHGTA